MSIKSHLLFFLFTFLSLTISSNNGNKTSYIREHKLSDRVTIFTENEGKDWGAKVNGKVVLQPIYSGIDLLGTDNLKLIKYDAETGRLFYGTANYSGKEHLACEYELIVLQNGRIQAFRPPVILDSSLEDAANSSENKKHNEGVPNSHLFETGAPKTVVEYMSGETDSPAMNLPLIRSEIDKQNEPKSLADKMPNFVGGDDKLEQFIRENLRYPEEARAAGVEGRVVVRFVVMPNGSLEKVEVLHGLEASCDREAVRLVESMPRWSAGVNNGKKVPVFYTLAISFF